LHRPKYSYISLDNLDILVQFLRDKLNRESIATPFLESTERLLPADQNFISRKLLAAKVNLFLPNQEG